MFLVFEEKGHWSSSSQPPCCKCFFLALVVNADLPRIAHARLLHYRAPKGSQGISGERTQIFFQFGSFSIIRNLSESFRRDASSFIQTRAGGKKPSDSNGREPRFMHDPDPGSLELISFTSNSFPPHPGTFGKTCCGFQPWCGLNAWYGPKHTVREP